MNIGIIGGGSIGLLVSSYLSTEHNITIYVRREQQKQALNHHGLLRSNSSTVCSVDALSIHELKEEDCFIICVKQAQIPEIVSIIQKKSNHHTPVIFLQNGMGHIDHLKKIVQPVFVGVVEHGACRENDYTVTHTGQGVIKLASYSGDGNLLERIINQLTFSIFPVKAVEDWKLLLREKLIINAVINPLTALFEVQNGEVLYNSHITKLAKELCREAATTLELDFLEQWNRVKSVAENTKENISSMWKDIKENRETEIEAISGYVLMKSNHHIPYTTFVYNSIRALEVKKGINN